MEYIFLLAERIVTNFKIQFNNCKNEIGFYSFENCIIKNTSIDILFKSINDDSISLRLSTHPLDMPWNIEILVNDKEVENDYYVYPNLLKSPETLGNALSEVMAKDVIMYLKNSK